MTRNSLHALSAADQEWIKTQIRLCYNEVVTGSKTGYVKMEPYGLLFVLALSRQDSRFAAGLMRLEDCRLPAEGPVELPKESVYTAAFDFIGGFKGIVNDRLLKPENEPVMVVVNEELERIFEILTTRLMEAQKQ
ncbi:hypothetical protein MO973_14550 [Paenibacillus sp. TRM 82003]|nr:hypothetical protein [Paenibacillus sp. TRM 82003]